jgi:hypothetical protein
LGETVICKAPVLPITDSPIPEIASVDLYIYFNDLYLARSGLAGLICSYNYYKTGIKTPEFF